MADKSFGVKELNLLNASGTPTITSPNNLNLNANTVAISTSVTIGQNLTVSVNAGIASLNVTGIATIAQPADSNPMANWTITNYSSSAYRFTGPGQDGSEDDPDLYLVRGHRYIFKHNATSSHPIQIRTVGGTVYTDGVTYSDTGNNRTTDGNNLIINLQHDAPAQLKYHCTAHPAMVGNIYTVGGPQVISGVVTATSFSGDGSNLTGITAGLSNIVEDSSPQLGGALDTNGNNITFGDSTGGGADDRLVFGAGSDLNLYSDGTNVRYEGNNLHFKNANGDEFLAKMTNGGAVELYYDNVKALETKVNQSNSGSGVIINNPTGTGNRVLDIKHTSGDYVFCAFMDQNTTSNGHVRLGALGNEMHIYAGGTWAVKIDTSGNFLPATNNSFDLGAPTVRWRNVYTYDLNLSNKGSTNSIDNTWGDYTIQEGESDLFLINNRNGKKYKFNLTEVS